MCTTMHLRLGAKSGPHGCISIMRVESVQVLPVDGMRIHTNLRDGGSELAPTLVKGVSDMSASMQSPYAGAVATCATIQIDRFGKLCAICSGSAQIHSGVTLCLAPVISESQREVAVYSVIDMGTTKTDEQIIADISQISGSQHVIFRMVANCNVTIKQVWLE